MLVPIYIITNRNYNSCYNTITSELHFNIISYWLSFSTCFL